MIESRNMSEAQCILLVGLLYVITFNQKRRGNVLIFVPFYIGFFYGNFFKDNF
jgi:hypothetical protein